MPMLRARDRFKPSLMTFTNNWYGPKKSAWAMPHTTSGGNISSGPDARMRNDCPIAWRMHPTMQKRAALFGLISLLMAKVATTAPTAHTIPSAPAIEYEAPNCAARTGTTNRSTPDTISIAVAPPYTMSCLCLFMRAPSHHF